MLGDYRRSVETGPGDIGYVEGLALLALGRREEVAREVRDRLLTGAGKLHPRIAQFLRMLLLMAEGDGGAFLEEGRQIFRDFIDPEGRFYWVRYLAQVGELDTALKELQRVVAGGYYCASSFAADAWLEPLRSRPEFAAILRDAGQRRREALHVFQACGGNELVGAEEPE
jgi:hypothetical protein